MRSGWAEADITPPLGLPMGGRGPRFTPGAVILDPLLAQVLILEDDAGNQTLWAAVDQLGVDRETGSRLRYALAECTGIPYAAVIVNFSHTHSGPMASLAAYASLIPASPALLAYGEERDRTIVGLAQKALAALRPAAITLHQGSSQIGINRRNRNAQGETAMLPNRAGLYLPQLPVFDIRTAQGGRALLFTHACHPVIVYGHAWDAISAEYPGVCRRQLRRNLGESVHCQFMQGFTGNIRPRIVADFAEGRFRKSTPEDVVATGITLAEDVMRALTLPGEALHLSLQAAQGWFSARRDAQALPPIEHWQALAASDNELDHNLGAYWTARYRAGTLTVAEPWRVGLLQVTPTLWIAWFAGEPVAEWLGHVQQWLGSERILGWGYCQDVCGYIPTDELLPEGGYEVVESNRFTISGPGIFAPGLNEAARQAFLALARQLELGEA
ncbi:MAG: hypothetical protein KF832_01060 [Caldilineaceae bacterium]|nr:hypothetical protein [Caldilineaceae bacterium]